MDSNLIDASSIMTVISLATFIGILWWTFRVKDKSDFDAAANLPFADDERRGDVTQGEKQHV